MPMKTTVGLCKKIGLPNYGSVGASCHVEFELDGSQPDQTPAVFEQRVRRVFAACSQAVQDELQRQQGTSPEQPSAMHQGIPEQTTPPTTNGRRASEKQMAYLMGVVSRNCGT